MQLAVSAWLTSKFNSLHNERSRFERDRVRFALFTSTWTICFSGLMLILFSHSLEDASVLEHLV
jgi:hypothetical protein